MQVIIREGDTLKYDNHREFNIADLFISAPYRKKNKFVSFDLTLTASVIIRDLVLKYECVGEMKQLKTPTQFLVIESPTRLYAIMTKYSEWTCLSARMGLDEDESNTLKSFNAVSVRELALRADKMGMTKLTVAGTALDTFRKSVTTGKLVINHKTHTVPKLTMDKWRGFSKADVPGLDYEYRSIFRGGMTWGRPGEYTSMSHIDRRSMYPSTASQFRMPYGIPTQERVNDTDLELVTPVGILTLKEGKIPMIGFSSPKTHREHALSGRMGALLEDIILTGDIWFYKFEWDVIVRMYAFDGQIAESRYVRTVPQTHLKAYFEACYQQKNHLKKGTDEYASAKKLLNALYGKLVVKLLRESISYEGKSRHTVHTLLTDLSYYNILAGAQITARARCSLMEMAEKIGLEHVVYLDTDSLFFDKSAFDDRDTMLKTCNIGKNMGDWDLEEEDVDLIVVGPKTYQTMSNNKTSTKCAGLPTSVSQDIPWGGLYEGLKVPVVKLRRNRNWVLNPENRLHTITSKPVLIKPK